MNSSSPQHPVVSSIALAHWKLVKWQSYHFTPDIISTNKLSNPFKSYAVHLSLDSFSLSLGVLPQYYKTLHCNSSALTQRLAFKILIMLTMVMEAQHPQSA